MTLKDKVQDPFLLKQTHRNLSFTLTKIHISFSSLVPTPASLCNVFVQPYHTLHQQKSASTCSIRAHHRRSASWMSPSFLASGLKGIQIDLSSISPSVALLFLVYCSLSTFHINNAQEVKIMVIQMKRNFSRTNLYK